MKVTKYKYSGTFCFSVMVILIFLFSFYSGHSGEEVQLCSKAIKTSDIDKPGHFEKHYESSSSSTHSDSSSDNEQDFVSSILPGNRPDATGIRPQLHKKCIMKKKAGQKARSKHEDKEQTVIDVAEQLGSCQLDSQEKAVARQLPLQKVDTEIPSNSPWQEKLEASEISENKCNSSKITLVGISKKSAEHFKKKFAKSNQVSRSASVQVCPEVAKANLVKVLKETLIEWKTEETLRFLYGPNYASVCQKPCSAPLVKEEELDEDDINPDPDSRSSALQESQNSLDESLPFRASDTAIKPLPSYENLKKETETLNLRIREFYRGRYVLNEETTKSQDSEEVCLYDNEFSMLLTYRTLTIANLGAGRILKRSLLNLQKVSLVFRSFGLKCHLQYWHYYLPEKLKFAPRIFS